MATRVSELGGGIDLLGEDERALVLAFQEGDPDAFASIYRRYRPLAGAVCLKILGNRDDAEEAAQETMLRVLQGLPRFNGRYQLGAWVARIATNVSLDALRARARRPRNGGSTDEVEELRPDGTEDPLELVERMFERERVRAVLDELPPHHREALVLREFEGRSHREIAERLGMTPAQAKALIHRAKGTFRRAWGGDGRHHGLAALLLLWPARLPGVLRRLFGQAHEAASAAGSGAAAQAATAAASSPAVVAGAPGLAERLTATAVTVLVVGSVGVGAVVVKDRARRAEPEEPTAVAAPTTAPQVAVVAPEREPQRRPAAERGARRHDRRERGGRDGRGAAQEAETPPDASGGAPPAAGPSPSPSPTPAPIPPAPAWTFSFGVGWRSVEPCNCDPTPRLISSSVEGTVQDGFTFTQVVEGAIYDADADPTWPFHLGLAGSVDPSGGRLEHRFVLWSLAGPYSYAGEASLDSVAVGENGAIVYTFVGSYALDEGQAPVAGVPQQGTLTLTLSVWPDGTLFSGSFALAEAAG